MALIGVPPPRAPPPRQLTSPAANRRARRVLSCPSAISLRIAQLIRSLPDWLLSFFSSLFGKLFHFIWFCFYGIVRVRCPCSSIPNVRLKQFKCQSAKWLVVLLDWSIHSITFVLSVFVFFIVLFHTYFCINLHTIKLSGCLSRAGPVVDCVCTQKQCLHGVNI